MAYKPPWPAFQYTQPDTSQPYSPNSQMMNWYSNYGFGPEHQFFNWADLYAPPSRVRDGWEGQRSSAGLAQAGQQQAAPQQQQASQDLLNWWRGSSYNPNSMTSTFWQNQH